MRRVLKLGATGKDVTYAQNILHRNRFKEDYYPHPGRGRVEVYTAQGFRCSKWFLGYPAKLVNESFGTDLERYLVGPDHGGKALPKSYLARREDRLKASRHPVRWRIVDYCVWAEKHEPQFHYVQSRPFPETPRRLPVAVDCSGYVGISYLDALAGDPHRTPQKGVGNTGTLLARPHIPMSEALPGDVVVFGVGYGHHAAIVKEAGTNPLLSSHGSESGPISIRFTTEHRAQGFLPATFVRCL